MTFTQDQKTWETIVSKLIARAWLDEDFHKRFVSDPAKILREAGLVLEDFVKVIVTQGSTAFPVLKLAEGGTAICEISLPSKPTDLTDEQMNSWVAGMVDVNNSDLLGCSCC